MNVTTYLSLNESAGYVTLEACKAWAHNTMIKVSIAPVVWICVLMIYYFFMESDEKRKKMLKPYFSVLLWACFAHLLLMYYYKQV